MCVLLLRCLCPAGVGGPTRCSCSKCGSDWTWCNGACKWDWDEGECVGHTPHNAYAASAQHPTPPATPGDDEGRDPLGDYDDDELGCSAGDDECDDDPTVADLLHAAGRASSVRGGDDDDDDDDGDVDAFAADTALEALSVRYPGTRPDEATLKLTELDPQTKLYTLRNEILAVTWAVTSSGVALTKIHDRANAQAHVVAGGVFSVALANGTKIVSSHLAAVGDVATRSIVPDPASPKLADRYGGIAISMRFRHSVLAVDVVWEAELRDDANYVHQTVRVTPHAPATAGGDGEPDGPAAEEEAGGRGGQGAAEKGGEEGGPAAAAKGTYTESCSGCRVDDGVLACLCNNGKPDGAVVPTTLLVRACDGHPIVNDEGYLKCDAPTRHAAALGTTLDILEVVMLDVAVRRASQPPWLTHKKDESPGGVAAFGPNVFAALEHPLARNGDGGRQSLVLGTITAQHVSAHDGQQHSTHAHPRAPLFLQLPQPPLPFC